MRKKIIGAVAVMLFLAASGFAATLVNNGSFETCTTCTPSGGYSTVSAGDAGLAQWVIDSGNIDWVNTSLWHPPSGGGSYSIDLNGNTPGDIYQDLTVVAGQSYTITWYGGMDPDAKLIGGKNSVTGTVLVVDVVNHTDLQQAFFTVSYADNATRPNAIWEQFNTTFTATSNTVRIFFTSQESASNYGPLLDMVTMDNNVPEPAAWSLVFSGGLLCLAAAIRRRKPRS
jgi:choice-of-anchor C domain-containing protein